ncbi:MAG: right-handed parallel beta-helix repeat-containing protein [Actinomycetota bacterium]|nr:right-handed parallel beta-helix repeat-containing protein [Actinomycetota bacterium]
MRSRTPLRAVLAAIVISAGLVTSTDPGLAGGARRRIDVFPGPNAIGRAIEDARDGDILLIHRGRYREVVEVDKDVTIKGVGKRLPTIDGRCGTAVVVNVLVDGVTLKRLRVQGANEGFGGLPSEVNLAGVSDVAVRRLVFRDTCDAEYGINVYRTGPVVVARSVARGFSDAGLYVGGIEQGPVLFSRNEALDNNRGVIIEDSLPGTVVVADNLVRNNDEPGTGAEPSGIDIIRTDGVDVLRNVVRDNLVYGIRAYADLKNVSTSNRIYDNVISGSGSFDAYDETGENCWNGTTYGTASPNPPPTCP